MTEVHMKLGYEAEQIVLGSVLVTPSLIDDVSFLETRDFADRRHQAIWNGLRYLADTQQPIEFPSLTALLMEQKTLEEVGSVPYLTELASLAITTQNVVYYARRVQEKAKLQRLKLEIQKLADSMEKASSEEVEDILTRMDQIRDAVQPDETRGLRHISEARKEFWAEFDREDDYLKTGFPAYDRYYRGIRRGDLYILAGRPSVGKTAKMLQMATAMAKQEEGPVMIWSQEMSTHDLLLRITSAELAIPYRYMTADKDCMTPELRMEVDMKLDELEQYPFYVDDAAGANIDRIYATARQMKRKKGKLGGILIDYLQIMNIPQPNGMMRAQAIGHVTMTAKNMARDLECPVILLSQLNREKEREPIPHMGHLKESGSIEQDADTIEMIYQHPDDVEESKAIGKQLIRCKIVKHRRVGKNEFQGIFHDWIQRFELLSHEREGRPEK
jgi:replicative DNA helicase